MKKMLKRSISILMAVALCVVSMQLTALADSVSKAGIQSLSEWVEMADDLLNQGKTYVSGKAEFDTAYNNAVSLLNGGAASEDDCADCIEALKTAWAGLKVETVTEVTPNSGIANDTGYADFGSQYKTSSGKQPEIFYSINATGADFWADVEMFYIYAYGYQTDSVTEELFTGTTLPKGSAYATNRTVRFCTTDYVNNTYSSSKDNWAHRSLIRKFEFSKKNLNKFVNAAKISKIIFSYDGSNSSDVTLCAGSLFIVRSVYEQVPVSYELYKWVNRAENLLAQGKTYVSGLDEFNAAITAAKNATEADDEATLIANIKTAWANLKYSDAIEIAPVEGVANNTGCAGFGNYYKTAVGKSPTVKFDISASAKEAIATATEIYVYAYGYDTAAGTNSTEIYENLYQGEAAPNVGYIRIADISWSVNKYPTSEKKFTRGEVRKYTFAELPDANTIQFALGQDATVSTTIVVGSLFIVKGEKTEKLPSDRIFNWIDRAEKVLNMDVEFSDGLDEFNAAVEAMYNADATANEDALIADLREAWNTLGYDTTYQIGSPTIEKGTVIASYTKEDDKLGSKYVCAKSNGVPMSIRLDCDAEGGFKTDWFSDVKEIYFYTRGYRTEDLKAWTSQWTNATANTSFSSSEYYGGSNVNLALSKYVINKDTLLSKLKGNTFRNILITKDASDEAITWIVGSLFVTKTTKLSLADYGDVNGDGKVDVKDLVRSKKYLAGITNEIADYALDMNDDGKNAANDLVELRQKLLNVDGQYSDNTVTENEVF